ncbi:MAG: purine-nucleoside phosphorylase [Acetanaerobacterium sp.]
MSTHIGAKKGDIASKILLPGDPYRARYIAEHYLQNPVCYNEVRGMLGFTGTYREQRISVQGTGMGIPSISIYLNELLGEYGCNELYRIGTCGSYREDVGVLDVILAQAACTTSAVNDCIFGHAHYAPIADFSLLHRAYGTARERKLSVHVGSILTDDRFYHEEDDTLWQRWRNYGVLGVEMETAALYTLAAKYGARALSILTVSDHLITGEQTDSATRERALDDMIRLALDTAAQ